MSKLPSGDLYTIFDESSKCDNEEVQEMWASLIVSSASDTLKSKMLKSFAETLKQLGSDDVKILMFLNTGSSLSLRIQRFQSSILNAEKKITRKHFFSSSDDTLESLTANTPGWKVDLEKDILSLQALAKKWLVNFEDQIASREHLIRLGCISMSSEFDVSQAMIDISDQFERSVERPSAFGIDEGGFDNLMVEIANSIKTLAGNFSHVDSAALYNEKKNVKSVPYELTDYGRLLVDACAIELS